jgi:DNA-binding transcriptional regulator YiaG
LTGLELISACKQIGMSLEDFAVHHGFSSRTARRWAKSKQVPGPVRAVALAWLQCHRNGVDYGNVAFIGNARHDSHDWLIV